MITSASCTGHFVKPSNSAEQNINHKKCTKRKKKEKNKEFIFETNKISSLLRCKKIPIGRMNFTEHFQNTTQRCKLSLIKALSIKRRLHRLTDTHQYAKVKNHFEENSLTTPRDVNNTKRMHSDEQQQQKMWHKLFTVICRNEMSRGIRSKVCERKWSKVVLIWLCVALWMWAVPGDGPGTVLQLSV